MAADPNYAFEIVWDHEGRQCENIEGDPGGLTAWGITFASAQQFWGASKVTVEFMVNLSEDDARAFYLDRWSHNFDHIEDDVTACKLFDAHVNMGMHAIECAQRALGVSVVDGVLGPLTVSAINNADQASFREKLHQELEHYYINLVKRIPARSKFLTGWLRRANCKCTWNVPCEIHDHQHLLVNG